MDRNYQLIDDLIATMEIPEDGILTRTLHDDENLKVILFGFSPGQELSEHTAAMPAVMHFLQGEADITLENDQKTVTAGAWVHMSANMPHSVHAKTPVAMLLSMLKSAKKE